jgi:inosose dehydratase
MTWRGWLRKQDQPFDLDRVLREIAEAGYGGTELGGDRDANGPADQLKQTLADAGLQLGAWGAKGVTANPHPPSMDQFRRDADYAVEMGLETLMVCGGFLPEKRRTTVESDYELFAGVVHEAAEHARGNGQRIAYHPHLGCIIETLEELDRLMAYEPDIDLCIDTGHLLGARSNPTDMLRKYPDKVRYVHLKDYSYADRCFMELGRGDTGFDFAGFFQALEEIGYGDGWLMVERDAVPMEPIESAKISRTFLRDMGF